MSDERKGYWAGMLLPIKVCAPLTFLMITLGAVLMSVGYDNGIILIGTPLIVIGLRVFLYMLLEIGPPTIFGYTYDYLTNRIETAYNLPKGLIAGAFVFVFVLAVFVLMMTGY